MHHFDARAVTLTTRRGLVMGILTASTATGQLLFLPSLASTVEEKGWRAALLMVAAVTTVGLSLLPILIGFDRPAAAELVLAAGRRAAVASSLIWAVCALVALVLQTAELHPGGKVARHVHVVSPRPPAGAGEGASRRRT